MRAKMALRRCAIVGVHVNRIVRTCLHTGLTPNAAVGVEIDNAVLALVHRRHRTDGDARRLLAVVAARDLKYTPRVGEHAFLDVLDPRPIDATGTWFSSCTPRYRRGIRCTCDYR